MRPDKRTVGDKEAVDMGRNVTSGDLVLVTNSVSGRMDFRNIPEQKRATLGRAKSASAILLQGSFHQVKAKEEVKKLDTSQLGKNLDVKVKKNIVGPDEFSEDSMELWYFNRLQTNSVNWSPTAESGLFIEALTGVAKHFVNVHLTASEVASNKTSVVALRPSEHEDHTPTSVIPDVQEPLVYLCVKTAPEEHVGATPSKKENGINLAKPRLLKRTLTWPNEHLRCKEVTSDSYDDFLKTLNISPRPNQSHFASHITKKTQLQKYNHGTSNATSLTGTNENILIKGTKTVRPGRHIEMSNPGEHNSRDGQQCTYSPSKVSQRSSHGKRTPVKKVVSLDSEVQREDLQSQESETQSDLRSTPEDDDKLLENNEYHFIDLLHEVVENHGRWTRDRWRQTHQRSSSRPSPQC